VDRKRIKFIVLGSGVALSMAFLLVVGLSNSGGFAYYLTVSEYLERNLPSSDGVRVNGKVTPGTIERLPGGEDVRFTMSDGTRSMPVAFHGIIPDTFVDEADVVVEGRLGDDGTFVAHTLLAKCPSKYESADDAGSDPPAASRS
jgi:cytochrome c-type biogenesis protein CcmE